MDTPNTAALRRTPFHPLHLAAGAKMVAFAGWDMPIQYAPGILQEHLHTRAHAGLFDVSHMGQIEVSGPGAGAWQGGGDQTRGASKWRTQGQLFDDDDPAASFNGIVGEDPAARAAKTPPKRG